jgi:hypothetical protein
MVTTFVADADMRPKDWAEVVIQPRPLSEYERLQFKEQWDALARGRRPGPTIVHGGVEVVTLDHCATCLPATIVSQEFA